jgi:HK97 gp10 family phage protein
MTTNDGGISRLQARLAAIPRDVTAALQPALKLQANTIADTMERFAPEDTGLLKGSIAVTPGGQATPAYSVPGGSYVVPVNAVAITAGDSDVRYAHLVEYGTKHAAAQPYFWPAYRLHKKRAARAVKSAIRREVRKNWGRG